MNVVNVVPMSSSVPPPRHREHPHVTVLRAETIAALAPRAGGVYLDVTLGGGGHAEAILEVAGTHVWGADRDAAALELARRRLERFGDRLHTVQACFSELAATLRAAGVERVDGIVADLGVSSMQLDEPARGLSFRSAGPLDMRMDASVAKRRSSSSIASMTTSWPTSSTATARSGGRAAWRAASSRHVLRASWSPPSTCAARWCAPWDRRGSAASTRPRAPSRRCAWP